MKILSCICISLLTFCLIAAAEDKGAQNAPAVPGMPETAQGKVLKVYACKDGDYKFIAYAVKWKDQEVIVSDTLAKSDYKVGDTIDFLVVKTHLPNANPEYLLNFQIMPPRPQLLAMPQKIPVMPAQPTTGATK
jgi:hypothetical protein